MKIVDDVRDALNKVGDTWSDRDHIAQRAKETIVEVPARWRSSDRGAKATIAVIALLALMLIAMTVR